MAETWPSLVTYLEDTGLPHRVTSTTGGGHTAGSYHYQGQAIDAAGPVPSYSSPELVAIQHSWLDVADQLAELIGPDPDLCVKYGVLHRYSSGTMEDHQDHVHTAATVNVTHSHPASDDERRAALITTALLSHPSWDGYVEVQEDGGVFAFDAPFYGSVPGLEGQPALHGMDRIIAAAVTPTGEGYWLMSANGNIYAFGDAPYLGARDHHD